MSVASTTLAPGVWGDPRVRYLAELGQYADGIYSAVARLGHLWARCTYLGTDVPGLVEIRACLGPRGEEHLVECGLGELLDDDGIRVRGSIADDGTDRIGWFRQRHPSPTEPGSATPSGRARGGVARKGAPRVGGRFVKSTTNPAGDQHPPADRVNAGEAGTSISVDAGASGSGSGSEERISPARVGNAGDAGDQLDQHRSPAGANAGASIVAGRPLGRVLETIWTYGQRKHLELRSSGIDPHAQAWSALPGGTGDTDLRERIREMQERGKTEEEIIAVGKHVIDVRAAEAQAFKPPHLRYFIASRSFTAEAWSKASELSPTQAAAQAALKNGAPPRPAPSRAHEPERRRSEPFKP